MGFFKIYYRTVTRRPKAIFLGIILPSFGFFVGSAGISVLSGTKQNWKINIFGALAWCLSLWMLDLIVWYAIWRRVGEGRARQFHALSRTDSKPGVSRDSEVAE